MKLLRFFTRKKLQATTARRSLGGAEMEYEEMSEPNMKLSRALLIVLVLHVVAVAGIIAFNAIKTRQALPLPVSTHSATSKVAPTSSSQTTGPTVDNAALRQAQGLERVEPARRPYQPIVPPSRSDETKVSKVSTKPSAKDDHKTDAAKPAENNSKKAEPAKTYVVAKGDNPVSIARKLKVPYDDLMAANHIDDPHKLQIGQKLIVPTKPAKSKKGE